MDLMDLMYCFPLLEHCMVDKLGVSVGVGVGFDVGIVVSGSLVFIGIDGRCFVAATGGILSFTLISSTLRIADCSTANMLSLAALSSRLGAA